MNILIIGNPSEEFCLQIKKSAYSDKLYTASETPLDTVANIEYYDFEDLTRKILALQIDSVIILDKVFIANGITEHLKKYRINVISSNSKWFNLEKSKLVAKQLAAHYSFNLPETIKAPLTFPIILKTDDGNFCKIVNSMQELIKIVNTFKGEHYFLEDFLQGEVYEHLSLWDGKNLWNIPPKKSFTEVQKERLDIYNTKLNFMLSDENANFSGFFISKLIWTKNDWYLLSYKMCLEEKFIIENAQIDFIRLIYMAIYQKLNEI